MDNHNSSSAQIEKLIADLKHWDRKQNAIDLLSEIGDNAVEPLTEAIKNGDRFSQGEMIKMLARIGGKMALEAIVAFYCDLPVEEVDLYIYAEHALQQMGEFAVERLLPDLNSSNLRRRWRVTQFLGGRDERAIPFLVNNLNTGTPKERQIAVSGLGRFLESSFIDPLPVKALEAVLDVLNDSDKVVRVCSAVALASIGDQRAFETLRAFSTDDDPNFRSAAIEALGHIPDDRVIDLLVHASHDNDPSVRASSIFALGLTHNPSVIDCLMQAMQDSDASVRERAKISLEWVKLWK